MKGYMYILQCCDESYYAGSTNDLPPLQVFFTCNCCKFFARAGISPLQGVLHLQIILV